MDANESHFRRTLRGVGVTGAVVNVDDIGLSRHEVRHYTSITAENEDTAASDARVGVFSHGQLHTRAHLLNLAVDSPQNYSEERITVVWPEKLRVVFENSANGDGLVVTVEGFIERRS